MHATKDFTVWIIYCLSTIKPSTSPCINRLTFIVHITNQYDLKFETNSPIEWNPNKDCSSLEKKVKLKTHCLNLLIKELEKVNEHS
jgi:hypothetical protein